MNKVIKLNIKQQPTLKFMTALYRKQGLSLADAKRNAKIYMSGFNQAKKYQIKYKSKIIKFRK